VYCGRVCVVVNVCVCVCERERERAVVFCNEFFLSNLTVQNRNGEIIVAF